MKPGDKWWVPPRLEERQGKHEVHIGHAEELRVCCGANNTIEIDKLYGPLCAELVRVRLQYETPPGGPAVSDWVVERYNLTTEQWEEKARWDCQESYPENDDE